MSFGLESLRVLLVDDNPHMRSIVATILKGVGVRTLREASDGAEGLQALRDWPADLAIVDFQMQPLDGASFTRIVRGSADSANIYLPIIMLTGYADRSRVLEARDAGVTELIVKPVTAQAVIARLSSAQVGRRLYRTRAPRRGRPETDGLTFPRLPGELRLTRHAPCPGFP